MTDSIEELARFWDSHDLIDFGAELEEVAEPVFERKPGAGVESDTLASSKLVNGACDDVQRHLDPIEDMDAGSQ